MILVFVKEKFCRDSQALLALGLHFDDFENIDPLSVEYENCWKDVGGPILVGVFNENEEKVKEKLQKIYPDVSKDIFFILKINKFEYSDLHNQGQKYSLPNSESDGLMDFQQKAKILRDGQLALDRILSKNYANEEQYEEVNSLKDLEVAKTVIKRLLDLKFCPVCEKTDEENKIM